MRILHKTAIFTLIILLCVTLIPLSFAQSAQTEIIEVDTNQNVLATFTDLNHAPNIGEYSIVITRGMTVYPANIGDEVLHGDIITVQQGATASLRLVDRPNRLTLQGGDYGSSILFQRGSSTISTTPAVEKPGMETYLLPAGDEIKAGRVVGVAGDVYILRSERVFHATLGETLLVGDAIGTGPDSSLTVEFSDLDSHVQFPENSLYTIQREAEEDNIFTPLLNLIEEIESEIQKIVDDVKNILIGDSFDNNAPSEAAGSRA